MIGLRNFSVNCSFCNELYNGTLLNGVLRPKLLNILFVSCFLINFGFLAPNIAHFENNIVLLLLFFETLGFMFSVFFLHFTQ